MHIYLNEITYLQSKLSPRQLKEDILGTLHVLAVLLQRDICSLGETSLPLNPHPPQTNCWSIYTHFVDISLSL